MQQVVDRRFVDLQSVDLQRVGLQFAGSSDWQCVEVLLQFPTLDA